jgi:hypothetical protein
MSAAGPPQALAARGERRASAVRGRHARPIRAAGLVADLPAALHRHRRRLRRSARRPDAHDRRRQLSP